MQLLSTVHGSSSSLAVAADAAAVSKAVGGSGLGMGGRSTRAVQLYASIFCRSNCLVPVSAGSQEVVFHLLHHPETTNSLKGFLRESTNWTLLHPECVAWMKLGTCGPSQQEMAVIKQEHTD